METRNLRRYALRIVLNREYALLSLRVPQEASAAYKKLAVGISFLRSSLVYSSVSAKASGNLFMMKLSVASLVVAAFALAGPASASPAASPSNTTVLESLEVGSLNATFFILFIEITFYAETYTGRRLHLHGHQLGWHLQR